MIRSLTTSLCILALTGTLAFGQSSQSRAGTGPSYPMNSNAMMKKHHARKHDTSKPGMPDSNMPSGNTSSGEPKTEGMRNGIGMVR